MSLETRSFQIREVNDEDRTVTGIAVPFDTPTNIGGYREQFARGAISSIEGVKLFWNHTDVIGRVTAGRETDEGYEVTARISDTTLGRDAYVHLKDGNVDKFSVGFIPGEDRLEEDGTLTRTKVELKEVSLVPFPAYAGAQISEVRNDTDSNKMKEVVSGDTAHNDMTEIIDTEARSGLENLERRLEVALEGNAATAAAPATQFRSGGEFLKALSTGDDTAQTEIRAYTGAVLADSHTSNDWKNDLLKIVDRGRPVINAFDKGTLDNRGNSVEFPKVSGVTGDVAVQAAEGDNLAYLEVGITTATAPVKTYGGYSEISRQAIERSDIAYLDSVLRAQAASYAKVTNAAVRTALTAATPQTSGVASFALTAATAQTFVSIASDAVQKIDTNGYYGNSADFMLVSWDVYNKMVTLVDGNQRPVFDLNNDGANTVGNVNIAGARATVAGLPVLVDSGLSAKSLYVCNSHAVTTWENPGAPVSLSDENIINLTKQFSLYGYMAVGVKDSNGLVKATIS